MHLHIQPNRLVGDLQKEFSSQFPFLKVEFLEKRMNRQSGSPVQKILQREQRIADGQSAITDGDMEISPEMSVKELEGLFKDQFSMAIQVLRLSGKIWLQTTMTENWTLRHQDEHGREISAPLNLPAGRQVPQGGNSDS